MVGVHMRLERQLEAHAELLDQRRVAPRLLEHRVDEQCITRGGVGQQVGIGGGLRVVELAEYHPRRTLLSSPDEVTSWLRTRRAQGQLPRSGSVEDAQRLAVGPRRQRRLLAQSGADARVPVLRPEAGKLSAQRV